MSVGIEASKARSEAARRRSADHISGPQKARLLVLLATTLPPVVGVSLEISVGGGTLYLTDVLLPLSALASLAALHSRKPKLCFNLLVLLIAYAIWLGIARGAPLQWIVRDGRGWGYLAAGLPIGAELKESGPEAWRWAFSRVSCYLVVMAGLISVETADPSLKLVTGIKQNYVYYGQFQNQQLASARIDSNLTGFNLLVLCCVIAYVLFATRERLKNPFLWSTLAATLLISFLSFSRNGVVAVAIAALLALASRAESSHAQKLGRFLRGFGALGLIAFFVSISGIAGAQVSTFYDRVVLGLHSSSIAVDPSVLWRNKENSYADSTLHAYLGTGTGFGVPYRPNLPDQPFPGDPTGGRTYLHNGFLTVPLKVGIVGTLLLVFVFALALLAVRYKTSGVLSSFDRAVAVGAVSLTAVAAAAPFILQSQSSAAFGAALGFMLAAAPADHTLRRLGARTAVS